MGNPVANNIRKFRESFRYTPDNVATMLGIDVALYRIYENGENELPYEVLESLSNLYGCEMLSLFENNAESIASGLSPANCIDGLTAGDMVEISKFNDIETSYLKLTELERELNS